MKLRVQSKRAIKMKRGAYRLEYEDDFEYMFGGSSGLDLLSHETTIQNIGA